MIRTRGGNSWKDDITIKPEHRFHSSFKDAVTLSATKAIRFLSPSDQISMALEIMGKPSVDTEDDAEREDRLLRLSNTMADVTAELEAVKADNAKLRKAAK
tara:strand:+ start:21626 stop:21928 length:303 start_codon:yes stop_codon:yes gene_type:complete